MKKTKSLQATAYHEAGHAVADWRHGFKVKRISIVPKGDSAGHVRTVTRLPYRALAWMSPNSASNWRFHLQIVSLLAGDAAQRLYDPRSVRSWHARGDIEAASALLTRLHSDGELKHVFRYLDARACNLVSHPHNWRMIQDLAKVLLERSVIAGQEVEATLRASLRAQRMEEERRRENKSRRGGMVC